METLAEQENVASAERHYAVIEVAEMWHLSADKVREIFAWKNDPVISSLDEVRARDTRNQLPVTSSFYSANFGGAGGNRTHA